MRAIALIGCVTDLLVEVEGQAARISAATSGSGSMSRSPRTGRSAACSRPLRSSRARSARSERTGRGSRGASSTECVGGSAQGMVRPPSPRAQPIYGAVSIASHNHDRGLHQRTAALRFERPTPYALQGSPAVQTMKAALVAAIGVVALICCLLPSSAEENSRLALIVSIEGAIGPASASYVKEALAKASERRAQVVLLRINTPGGLNSSMREIIADVLASPVPVVGYVAPSGAHAASAGTYILYATHIAAMAPGTNIGAATPVQIGGPLPGLPGGTPDKGGKDKKDGDQQSEPKDQSKDQSKDQFKDAMTAKVTNDAVAFIRSLAELRGRNADWAEKAVREAATLSANGALQSHAIELVARDQAELLRQLDGREVEVAGGKTQRLATKDAVVEAIDPGWISRFLAVITDPNVAFILLMVGIYGLIFEFMSPGAVAPGVVGAICLLIGLYALNLLPISYAGLALMLVGIVLLTVEAFNPTVVIGLGGIIAFVLGALMLFRVEAPGYHLSWWVIGITAAVFAGFALVVLGSLRRAARAPERVGAQAMRGLPAEVLDWSGSEGHVFAHGERWQARGAETFKPGETVEVANVVDLTLLIRRAPARTGEGGTS
ncbi:membrane-bound serine protease (ClpP class) [Bradyrhizobium sp. CIR3A]|nr:membrane-bound serine protease (ClpP class) [Bradyrhizobium sp. CIR3A]